MTKAEVEQKARRIGARRKRHSDEGEAIQAAVAEVVSEARDASVPMEKLASLLGMHRSSIYELYMGEPNGDGTAESAAGRPAAA